MNRSELSNSIRELGEQVIALADKIDADVKAKLIPRQKYTLAEAHAIIRAALPKKSFFISIETQNNTWSDDIKTEWKVWDGAKFHESKTLEGVVNLVLGKNSQHEPPLAVAVAVLDEATADDDTVPLTESEVSALATMPM